MLYSTSSGPATTGMPQYPRRFCCGAHCCEQRLCLQGKLFCFFVKSEEIIFTLKLMRAWSSCLSTASIGFSGPFRGKDSRAPLFFWECVCWGCAGGHRPDPVNPWIWEPWILCSPIHCKHALWFHTAKATGKCFNVTLISMESEACDYLLPLKSMRLKTLHLDEIIFCSFIDIFLNWKCNKFKWSELWSEHKHVCSEVPLNTVGLTPL